MPPRPLPLPLRLSLACIVSVYPVLALPKAIPVDMFPHTPHIELVMVFERVDMERDGGKDSPRRSEPGDKASPPAEPPAVPSRDSGVQEPSVKSSVSGDAAERQDERDRSESKPRPEGQ